MFDDDNKTLYCGNLSHQVTEEILYELFLQAGPLDRVSLPRDKDGEPKGFAFITYSDAVSVPYALQLYRGTALYNKTLTLRCRGRTVPLPPPLRCDTLLEYNEFHYQNNITKKFEEMIQRNGKPEPNVVNVIRNSKNIDENVSVASLKGNCSYRHQPYRNEREDRRHRDKREVYYERNNAYHNFPRNRDRDKRGNYHHNSRRH